MMRLQIILISLFLINCNGQEKNKIKDLKENDKMITNKLIEQVLEKQLLSGASGLYEEIADGETYEYNKEDLDVIIPLQKSKLQSSGYKFLNTIDFNNRVKEIFGRIIDSNSNTKYLYITPIDKCEREIIFNRNKYTASINPPSYYIIKNENFITDLYAIPEIIDYKKEYPRIAKVEDTIKIVKIINNNNVELNLWKNEDNLFERRYFNDQLLIHRNKYLFNDNRASLAWLKFNDEYFLESLVKTFGYTEDKDLLAWVMERNKEKAKARELINSSVFVRNCKGELEIRNGILKYIEEHTTESEESQSFAFELGAYDVENPNFGWTAKERFKIMAYIANTYDYLYLKSSTLGNTNRGRISYLGGIFSISNKNDNEKSWNELVKNFKANNYYNLPHLKDAVDHAYEYESFEL